MFDQILDLVGQPPGSLVYHFINLFAVEFALAISFGQWMRERDSKTARLTIAIVGIFAARILVLIASLLAWRGYLPHNVLLPPIERTIDTVTVLSLGWAFITMDDPTILRRNFVPDLVAAVVVGMMLAGFVGTYYYWFFAASRGQLFNGSWLDIVWSIAQIVLALAGLIWMLTRARYVYDPFLKGMMLIILGGAAGVHLVQPVLGDVAAAMRIGQIAVMPMLTAVAYRHVVEQLLHWDEFEPSPVFQAAPAAQPTVRAPEPAEPPPSPPPESIEETRRTQAPPADKATPAGQPPLLDVVEAIGMLLSTLEQSEIARQAARSVATALRADIAVLAIVDEAAQQVAILGAYDNIAQTYLPRGVLDLAEHPSIANALGRARQMRLTTQRNLRELRDLYEQLRITHEGPAYLQPLVNGDERIGVLIVGSPYSERQLSNEERNLLDRLGPLVTAALLNAETYRKVRTESDQIVAEEGARLASLADELTAVTSELHDARRQIQEMKSYIRGLHRQVESFPEQQEAARQQIESLLSEIERLRQEKSEVSQAPQTDERLQARLEELLQEIERLRPDAEAAQQMRDENERLRLERALQQRLNTERLGELEQERQQLMQEVARLQKLQEENALLLERVKEVEKLEQELKQLREAAKAQEAALTSQSVAEQESLQRQLDEARKAAQIEIASLRARLAQASISQQEVAFLQEQLAAKSREIISLQTRLAEAQAVAEALRDQVSGGLGSTRALEALQARVAAQMSEIAALKAELAEARSSASLDMETLRAQQALDQSDREAMVQLEAQLVERSALIEALEAQLAEKARAIVDLRSHLAEVETSLRNLEVQLSYKTDEIAALQASLAETRAQAQARIDALQAEIDSGVRDASDVERARVEMLEAELAEKSAAIRLLEEQLRNASSSMMALEGQLTATSQAVDAAIAGAQQVDSHNEVIASIAQELRTPMSSIMGYTELLLRESVGILGTLQRKFLQRVKANTERMGVLLDDLIRITALDAGRLQLEPERVDTVYAIEETLMNLANQFREKGLTLRMVLPDDLPSITADRDAFLQIMSHLLSNAALASPVEGEIGLLVSSRSDRLATEDGQAVEVPCLYIAVEDSGGGVAEEDFERVFARKYRADNPLIEGLGDTGVGLSLAKTLIEAHGGRIWLDSEPGVGTTFHVLLPLELEAGSRDTL